MLKCVGSCPEGDGQSLEEEPCFPPGTRGVGAGQPWSKPLLQVLFLVQMMLLVEKKKVEYAFLYHYCSRHTCCFFQCDPIKKKARPSFCVLLPKSIFTVGCSHGPLKTPLSAALLRGTNRERGDLFRSTQHGVQLLCKTEDGIVWLYASSLFSGLPVLPIIQFLSVSSLDHAIKFTLQDCACSWNAWCCYRLRNWRSDWRADLKAVLQLSSCMGNRTSWCHRTSSIGQQLSCQGLWLFSCKPYCRHHK